MIDLQILGTVPRPGKWNWSFGIWFYRKLSGSPRDEKIKHFAKYKCWNFFKLAHFFSHFSQCNPISNIHPKHTDHCFQFFSNQTWSITNITRMPLENTWEHLRTPENTWTLALDQLVRKSVQTNLGRNVAQIWLVKTLLPTYLVGNQPVWWKM